MLIVSKFHDYYDTALAHGIDKTCVYNRTTEKIKTTNDDRVLDCKAWHKKGDDPYRNKESEFLFQAIVGVAGELHPLLYHMFIDPDDGASTFMYDAESCKDFLDENFPETRAHDNEKSFRWRWQMDMSDGAIEEFFELEEDHKRFQRIFLDHKVPIFIARRARSYVVIETNPMLKDYGFMKVKDPYTAMQDIHMYLSGVIGMADRDTAEVGNDDRIKQRGFDKYSFRRDPTKRKNR